MPEPNISTCWDVANFCPLVVFVAGVHVVEFGSEEGSNSILGEKAHIVVSSKIMISWTAYVPNQIYAFTVSITITHSY